MIDYRKEMLDIVGSFEAMTSPQAVTDRLASVLSGFGFSAFLITQVPEPPLRLEPYILVNGWPRGWSELYSKRDYYREDPVAGFCRRTTNPFEWSEAPFSPERDLRSLEVMNVARDFGMVSGFLVPIVRTTGFHACVTMAGQNPDLDPIAKRAIHIISMFAHGRIAALEGASTARKTKKLTRTEREILSWAAVGKSSWDIATILNISKSSVDTIANRATKKLDAVNRTQAVVNALREGEISL